MQRYKIGLYEKAIRGTLTWKEKLLCAKECGYDYVEMCIDASEEKIQWIYRSSEERKNLVDTMYETGIPIRSMSVSALTKFALGDPDETKRSRGKEIMEESILLASDLGIRTVMIPGYDIYYGESTVETKQLFLKNLREGTEIAAREGVVLGMETMENDFMNTVEKGMKYVRIIRSPYLNMYPDSGNVTNAAELHHHDVCEDISLGRGSMISLHLKESKTGIFREVPFGTGHVEFERIIKEAWKNGIRRYVTELWDVGQDTWKEDICFANSSMRAILDKQQ
ncbi:putative hexulose-6-phosphate isomerase [[Clostridium] scindens ATCC 35704]|uniref:L-ribulose-5-phosphate 3-epimerase UlaE n=1 Tax=Clostridium scindens (strain ATCC 35704 / DSM 5676 / VPI 13733 / 19) TaxID=411468 RepID=B0NEL6_CLOS5|nr:L-ribulose-5-phosphate 3-epimerase [[Clostridium] scindens]EDS06987.1 putative hexulose-6-phosphate isomerase [[Clostridium] scindens ATCC 35704]QBF73054.1 L-ribulose-5-phosphate 3-epimerase UlaE [[Clostridium] scindens ATCC 35704]QRO36406.1 L-ribulose-5-phosphate 3-epimerase [[Clostridium] scindens]WPB35842.1 L-ribulose-5-phosphate 3-epimerase UlaE [[Clostridium] scindens]BDF17554.1 L-ribulose-5-phosphate 3-epimerase [[Clostridium] scindens]